MAQSIKQLHAQIQAMPSDSVKAIVLSWLNQSNGNLSDFERLIAETADRAQGYQWGEIDTTKQFQPLIEPQPIAQSKAICGKLKYKHRYLKNICADRR
jgi:hypothetical protein